MNYKDIEDNAYKMRTKKYEADLYAKLNAENPPKKMNVLVVNDEERKRSYIHRALEKFEAIQYIDAENGNDAKQFCEDNDIAIIVMDMSFPWEANGYEEGSSGVRLVKELQTICEKQGKTMPTLIVYSTMLFESAMKKAGESLIESFYGQTYFQGGLEDLLKDFFNQK